HARPSLPGTHPRPDPSIGVRLVPVCLHAYPPVGARPLARAGRPWCRVHSSLLAALESAGCARRTLLLGGGACLSPAPGAALARLSRQVRGIAPLRRAAMARVDQVPDGPPGWD